MSDYPRQLVLLSALVVFSSACLPQGKGDDGTVIIIMDEDTGPPDASTDGGLTCAGEGACAEGEGAPRIVSLTTNTNAMGPGDTLVISAVVTDPDGAADLLGGQLFDASGQSSYGSFSSSGPGSYTFDLTWQQLRALEEIQAPAGGTSRALRATFFDQQGSSSSRDLDIALRCDAPGDAICEGECADLQTDINNCGSCGTSDTSGERECVDGALTCPSGTSHCEGACISHYRRANDPRNCGACGNDCSARAREFFGLDTEMGCSEGRCVATVIDRSLGASCRGICGRAGMECRPEDTPCVGDDGNAPGCAIYQNPDETCKEGKRMGCDDTLDSTPFEGVNPCETIPLYGRLCWCGD